MLTLSESPFPHSVMCVASPPHGYCIACGRETIKMQWKCGVLRRGRGRGGSEVRSWDEYMTVLTARRLVGTFAQRHETSSKLPLQWKALSKGCVLPNGISSKASVGRAGSLLCNKQSGRRGDLDIHY